MQLMTKQLSAVYADQINQQFYKSSSQYVDLGTRLTQKIKQNKNYSQILQSGKEEFQRRHANLKVWSDLTLCESIEGTLDQIVIDITLQRQYDFFHGMNILDNFQELRVMPISVYEDPLAPGKLVCWDGQHTAIVLYIISQILNEDISKCRIPIVKYKSKLKSEMRMNFMVLNGEGKVPLDDIDKFHQMIFGTRTDGSQVPSWLLAEKKQQALENAKMFATHEKFYDTNEPGALTRLNELMNTKYDLVVTENFCAYFYEMCQSLRPVQPKECWLMYDFFRQCHLEKIAVDDQFIQDIVASLRTGLNGDFDSIALMTRAKAAYQEHYNKINGHLYGIRYPEGPMGLTFLIAQIKKHYKGSMPVGPQYWPVQSSHLF